MSDVVRIGAKPRVSPYRPLGVWFAFQLPAKLLLGVPVGDWSGSPRSTRLFVAPTGQIRLHCHDASETYGRHAVLEVAAKFLRTLERSAPMTVFGMLTPGNGDPPIDYSIVIGASVVIQRAIGREPPTAA
jgi:hypothetical protein